MYNKIYLNYKCPKYWVKYDMDYYESEENHYEDYIDVDELEDYCYFNYE